MAGADDIPAFRSMRTLRALRPLRAVSRWEGMRVSTRADAHCHAIGVGIVAMLIDHLSTFIRLWAAQRAALSVRCLGSEDFDRPRLATSSSRCRTVCFCGSCFCVTIITVPQ